MKRGFTLIEVLVALGVFGLAAGGVFAVLAAGADSRRRSEENVTAAMIAQTIVAEARARADSVLAPVAGARWPSDPRYACDIEYTTIEEGRSVFMRVMVRWQRRGRGQETSFDTIVLRKLGSGP